MIKPEILEMVEECKRKDSNCIICPHKQLCDDFGKLIKGESVCQTVRYGIEELVSFLTSQEVCEWKFARIYEIKDSTIQVFNTSCGGEVMDNGINKYCRFCGKLIKKG